ncbi:hypothetical protein OC861_006743, partial [Tilletia horrida]
AKTLLKNGQAVAFGKKHFALMLHLQEAREKLETVRRHCEAAEHQKNAIAAENTRLLTAVTAAEAGRDEATSSLQKVKSELYRSSSAYQKANDSIADLTAKLSQSEETCTATASEIEKLTAQIKHLTAELDTTRDAEVTAASKIATMSAELEEAKEQTLAATGDLNTAQTEAADLRAKLKTVEDQLSAAASEATTSDVPSTTNEWMALGMTLKTKIANCNAVKPRRSRSSRRPRATTLL